MFLQVKKFWNKKRKLCLNVIQIVSFPFLMIVASIFASAILNLGTYVGTFIRNVFELVA